MLLCMALGVRTECDTRKIELKCSLPVIFVYIHVFSCRGPVCTANSKAYICIWMMWTSTSKLACARMQFTCDRDRIERLVLLWWQIKCLALTYVCTYGLFAYICSNKVCIHIKVRGLCDLIRISKPNYAVWIFAIAYFIVSRKITQ